MKVRNKKTPTQKIYKYLFDFIVVFTGVFLAFVLSQYKDKKDEAEKRKALYIAVFEDLNSFYESGRTENKEGFVNAFTKNAVLLDSAIATKKLPVSINLYADSWNIPIINSLINSGLLKDTDIEFLKNVTKFNSSHQIFLEHIKDFNEFYKEKITANYDKGKDYFYKKGTNKLKPNYQYLNYGMSQLAKQGKILVEYARKISTDIKEKYIDKKKRITNKE